MMGQCECVVLCWCNSVRCNSVMCDGVMCAGGDSGDGL